MVGARGCCRVAGAEAYPKHRFCPALCRAGRHGGVLGRWTLACVIAGRRRAFLVVAFVRPSGKVAPKKTAARAKPKSQGRGLSRRQSQRQSQGQERGWWCTQGRFQWSARLRGAHNRDPQVRRVRQRVYRTLRPGVQSLRAGEDDEGADPALVEDLKANLKASRPAPRKGAGRPRTLRSTLFSSP